MQHYENIQFIDTASKLATFCEAARQYAFVAMDTEFIRENTYYPKLCLFQVRAGDDIACIDPLEINDLSPLWDLMFDNNIIKVFHAARQDLEIIYHMQKRLPQALFDTQIAAPLLGYAEQIGYATLVKELLGVELAKAHTRTDWQKRPLSDAQLHYAADDVYYLHTVFQIMKQKLEDLDRLSWLQDDFAQLCVHDLYEPDPESTWIHVKDINKINNRMLGVIQPLASWREKTARSKDLPRYWILRDEMMLDIAKLAPADMEQLRQIRSLPQKTAERYGTDILDIVKQGLNQKPEPLPEFRKQIKLSADQEAKLEALQALVSVKAGQHNINPAILAGKKALKRIVLGEAPSKVFIGWRGELLCQDLENLLSGKTQMVFDHDRLVIKPSND